VAAGIIRCIFVKIVEGYFLHSVCLSYVSHVQGGSQKLLLITNESIVSQ